MSGFWSGKTLSGVELVVFDAREFRAVRTAVELIVAVQKIAPRLVSLHGAQLDRDWGTDALRLGLEAGESVEAIVQRWEAGVLVFQTLRSKYLLYT